MLDGSQRAAVVEEEAPTELERPPVEQMRQVHPRRKMVSVVGGEMPWGDWEGHKVVEWLRERQMARKQGLVGV